MIETHQLQYIYEEGQQVLQFPDIRCNSREQLLITGPSGSGKTTLLHLLAGLRIPQKGEVKIKGHSFSQMSSTARDRFRGRQIGIVFQQMHFVQSLNVLENVMLPQYTAGLQQDKGRAEYLLDQLGLLSKKNKNIRHLSQGEQQRVAIARALVNKPALLLADEPTSSLDDGNSRRVIRLLEEMAAREEAALLVVTHDQRLKDVFSKQITL